MRIHMYMTPESIEEYLKGKVVHGVSSKNNGYIHVDVPAEEVLDTNYHGTKIIYHYTVRSRKSFIV